jgi:hypothetical protein
MTDRLYQSGMVEPMDPFQRHQLYRFSHFPMSSPMDQFGLEHPVDPIRRKRRLVSLIVVRTSRPRRTPGRHSCRNICYSVYRTTAIPSGFICCRPCRHHTPASWHTRRGKCASPTDHHTWHVHSRARDVFALLRGAGNTTGRSAQPCRSTLPLAGPLTVSIKRFTSSNGGRVPPGRKRRWPSSGSRWCDATPCSRA